MRISTEKEAEEFLKKEGFDVVETFFAKYEKETDEVLKKMNFPVVMKVSGKKIVHKRKINGVRLNILDHISGIKNFNELIKIQGANEVVVQKQILGKEFILGIKKTPEFGHVLSFGHGGSLVEKIADINFRVCPLEKTEIEKMIEETKIGGDLNSEEKKIVTNNLIKLNNLVEKFPDILELDINPLILQKEKGVVVDARISWE